MDIKTRNEKWEKPFYSSTTLNQPNLMSIVIMIKNIKNCTQLTVESIMSPQVGGDILVLPFPSVCPSVCLSGVTLWFPDHISRNN